MLLIGIDVGLQSNNTGLAVYDTEEKKIIEMFSCSFYEMQMHLHAYPAKYAGHKVGVVLENANMDPCNFRWAENKALAARFGRDVGKNQAGAIIVKQQCKVMNIPCLNIPPSTRRLSKHSPNNIGALLYPTKSTSEQFKKLTGYEGRTNEHNRDAGTLVWGMKSKRFEYLLTLQK